MITIEPTADVTTGRPQCAMTWEGRTSILTVEETYVTGEALFAAAIAAETDIALVKVLRKDIRAPDEVLGVMLGRVREERGLPASSKALRIEAVAGAKTMRPYVHVARGSTKASLSPDEARRMGRAWIDVAGRAKLDALVRHQLGEIGLDVVAVDGFFTALQALHREP